MFFNRLSRFIAVVGGVIFSSNALAGVIELNFPYGKEHSCQVTAKYWDGENKTYTCKQVFRGTNAPGQSGVGFCSGSQHILHLDHEESRLDISSNGRCAKTYLTNLLGEFKVKKTAELNNVKTGSWFLNGTDGADRKFINAVKSKSTRQPSWGAVDLRHFSQSNVLKIFLNKEYAICLKENAHGCRKRDEATYTQIARKAKSKKTNPIAD